VTRQFRRSFRPQDENAAVRLAAVQSLGSLEDPRAVDALVQALRTDTDARVREAAARRSARSTAARGSGTHCRARVEGHGGACEDRVGVGEIDDARAVKRRRRDS
jgi:hypothetical protein